jgi:two-component system sensor histidine kinase HydH
VTLWAWLQVLAATSGLTVAALALSRGASNPLSLPLSLLAVDQFIWNAASVGIELTGDPRYASVGAIAAPLFSPLAFHFVLTFIGRRRSLRLPLIAVYLIFGAQSALALSDFVIPGFDLPGGLHTYAVLLLLPSIPLAGVALVLVFNHLRVSALEPERWRARLLIAALILVAGLLITDELADLGLPVPRLATLGSFVFNVQLTHLMLGLRLTSDSRRLALGQAVVLALFLASAYLLLFVTFRDQQGILIVTMTALSLLLVAGLRVVGITLARAREGLERYATLGRFSAQMAHDLKNPLAAAKGAAEFLSEEMRRANQPRQQEFAGLIVQQLDRLHAVIDRYQRLSKLELALSDVDLNLLVGKVLALQGFAASNQIQVHSQLAPQAPRLSADPEILASALENLLKNAFEAMPQGGAVTVRTAVLRDGDWVAVSIQDTGHGMDARAREQAFTPFFTTRATGSGMGLPFVQQVARAHGGDVTLASEEGSGTLVQLLLPRQQ